MTTFIVTNLLLLVLWVWLKRADIPRLLTRLIGARRPVENNDTTLSWKLWGPLHVCCQVKSEDRDDFRPTTKRQLLILVAGKVCFYRKGYLERWYMSPHLWYLPDGTLYHTELQPAQSFEETILDMPRWMSAADVRRNTDQQAWFLVLTW